MSDAMDFTGKRVLITGASSGIGKACCKLLADQGANLVLLARDRDKLESVKKSCKSSENHEIISFDLINGNIKDLEIHLTRLAPFSGLVHAAGISPTIPLKVLKNEKLLEVFQLNVFSFIELIKILSKPKIRENSMSVVAISSVLSEVGEKGKSLYAMTKASLVALIKSLALEYASKQIRFNTVSPSVVNTPLSEKSIYRDSEDAMAAINTQHPLGLGEPEDVANAVSFLLSTQSRWITGTNMIVDGGYLAR